MLTPRLDELKSLLRPAAGGIYTVSSGSAEQRRMQRRLYDLADSADQAEVEAAWGAALARLPQARVVVLGIPSDVGAGFVRGANLGPQEIRARLLDASPHYRAADVVDLGDVRVVPQLLDDEMLSEAQLERTRAALYGAPASAALATTPAARLPVSPLSIAARALAIVRELRPEARVLVLGGDHSVAWPAVGAVARGRETTLGVLHFDAHTDLLASRLGVQYCFATWAYHANRLIGARGGLVQVGLRASRRTRAEWEAELGVRQYWMDEMAARSVDEIADEIVEAWRARGVRGVYVSNDIDGTDPAFAGATGTPEPGGLHPDTVVRLVTRIGAALPVWGADLVEVAPPLGGGAEPGTTLETAARYVEAQLAVMRG